MSNSTPIYYVEFPAADLPATKTFFLAVFGWTFTDYGPDYIAFENSGIAGGFFKSDKWATIDGGTALVVLRDQHLEKALERVIENGGKITQEIFAFPGGRRFHFVEPSGNELAVCALD